MSKNCFLAILRRASIRWPWPFSARVRKCMCAWHVKLHAHTRLESGSRDRSEISLEFIQAENDRALDRCVLLRNFCKRGDSKMIIKSNKGDKKRYFSRDMSATRNSCRIKIGLFFFLIHFLHTRLESCHSKITSCDLICWTITCRSSW